VSKGRTRLWVGAAQLGIGVLALASAAKAGEALSTATAAETSVDASASVATEVDAVVVTGARGTHPRTVANSPTPIDIISNAQITATGRTGLKDILASLVPSLVVPAQNGGGTSASVRPISIRGLTGDYVLILINGKRRHGTALINNLATIGGGSTPVDLDLIPASAIDHIEVLRDGAAAQYGSDAIAGVINIILKSGAEGGEAEATVGQDYASTGRLAQVYADYGHPFLGGFINFALSVDHHEPAPANGPSTGVLYPLVNGALDPREATANTNYGSAYGRSTRDNTINLSYNLSTPIGAGVDFYSFSTFSYRDIKDARGAYRPDDLASLPQIYPNGFQAYRLIHETDFQVAGGFKGELAGWNWDASSTFGEDHNWLGAANTLNASLGPTVDQTHFFMGKQIFNQWTNNLDVTRGFNVGLAKPLDVSWGFEHRWEQFAQVAGEPNAYRDGDYVVPNGGTPFDDLYHGEAEQAGLQSFTGTTPADASTHSRNNYAAYVDLGTNITSPWYVGLAGRAEHYDDSSGNTLSGKFSTRYEILPGLAIRGGVNNGFRAPSLAEQNFSTTQNTTIVNPTTGQVTLAQVKFLPVGNPAAIALGATPLRPETSLNYTAGITFEPSRRFRVTLDAYQIDISNRIVKSSPAINAGAATILAGLGFPGLSSAQFFTNGVNTRTQGLDAVAEYQQSLGPYGSVNWSVTYSENHTVITQINANAQNFNAISQRQLTEQTPRDRLSLGADWTRGKWHVHALETRYGDYKEPVNTTVDAPFGAKWIADLEISYAVRPNLTLAVGANNLFNTYPDRQPAAILALETTDTVLTHAPGYSLAAYGLPTSGGSLYGVDSPFGLNGGFYYARVGVKF
jgi:iron complex outermembrane receptor protein